MAGNVPGRNSGYMTTDQVRILQNIQNRIAWGRWGIARMVYNYWIRYSFLTMDNDDPFLGCSGDRYCNDVFCPVSCNCISDSTSLGHRFLQWDLSAVYLAAIEGGTSIHCPAISLVIVGDTASIGDPGSVNTATEYDHRHITYSENPRTARNQPVLSLFWGDGTCVPLYVLNGY